MKTKDLLIRCVAMREGGHWVAICLPFDLAVQGESVREVKAKLEEQIRDYLADALTGGQDHEHAEYLLERRAPIGYWLLYWLVGWIHAVRSVKKFKTAVPLVPAAA